MDSDPKLHNSSVSVIQKALRDLRPTVTQICTTLGIPGLAIGVIYEGEVIHEDYHGYRDVEAELAPDKDTIFYLASLTKAITAAAVGILVSEAALSWSTPLQDILPEVAGDPTTVSEKLNTVDLLGHRSGRAGSNALYLGSDGGLLLPKAESIPIWNSLPKVAPVRTKFMYNNFGYSLVGLAIERLSKMSYGEFLKRKLFDRLNMSHTFTYEPPDGNHSMTKAYATLSDGSLCEIEGHQYSDTSIMLAAGSVRSTLPDLLQFYGAFLQAIHSQFGTDGERADDGPFKELATILQPQIARPSDSFREASYAAGWFRTQLPAKLNGFGGDPSLATSMPVVGKDLPSRLLLSHPGDIAGCTANVSLLPETSSAIIVLANSIGLGNAPGGISDMLIETVLGGAPSVDYAELASRVASVAREQMMRVESKLEEERVPGTHPRPLHEYTGKYFNAIKNFFIEVELEDDGTLRFAFQGLNWDRHVLRHYHHDVFVWNPDYDEIAIRGQYCRNHQHYIFTFEGEEKASEDQADGPIDRLRWRYDELVAEGEIFRKVS